jgi:uncharacterized protein (TIRG00374 family)
VVALAVMAVSLYVLAPSLTAVFASWRAVVDLSPAWLAAVVLLEASSFVSLWALQRITVRTDAWFPVATSQLAGNAFGHVVPGGLAAAGALQFQMLTRAGVPAAAIATGLTAASALTLAMLLALPVLAIPTVLAGTPVNRLLSEAAYGGLTVFLLLIATAAVLLATTRPLVLVAEIVQGVRNRVRRHHAPAIDFVARALRERDALRSALGRNRLRALVAAAGNIGLDYLALLAALAAVGSDAPRSIVLLAYVAAVLLGLVPFTPGGLGFVEAGLTGTLVLAGVGTADAVVATLVYRLASFWLPMPVGLVAYAAFRHRYRVHEGPRSRDERAP